MLLNPIPSLSLNVNMQVLFPATFIVHCRQHCTNCSSSCSRSIIENEFEGKLALSSTYPTSPPPHFYCFPFLDPPPLPPHYLLFLLLLLLIFSIVFPPRSPPHPFPPPHTQNWPYIHWPHIESTSSKHWPHISLSLQHSSIRWEMVMTLVPLETETLKISKSRSPWAPGKRSE